MTRCDWAGWAGWPWAARLLLPPVPKLMSTKSSKTTGILRWQKGCSTAFPFRCWYLASAGWTATAVSPSMVSIRVVATITSSSGKDRDEGRFQASRGATGGISFPLMKLVYLIRPPCTQKTPELQTPLSPCTQALGAESCRSAPSYPPTNHKLPSGFQQKQQELKD